MRFCPFPLRGILCLAAFAGLLVAQTHSVALLPGALGTSTTVPVYMADANSFGPQTTINGLPAGVFKIIPKPDGVKYYVISSTAGSGITVVNNTLGTPQKIAGTISGVVTAAEISPDGRRLIVVSGNQIYVIDTAFDSVVATFTVTGVPADITFSLDSARAFVLSNGLSGATTAAYITPIELSFNSLGTALVVPVSGNATGLSTAPTGFLYLTALNALFEINPRNLQRTTDTPFISVNGTPSKPVLTRDGKFAIAVNDTPSTGALAFIFDLTNRTSATVSRAGQTVSRLDQIVIAGDNRIFAYAKENTTLYEISLAGGSLLPGGLQISLPTNAVNAFAVSNEYPVRTMFVAATTNGINTLYRVDPTNYFVDANRLALASSAGSTLQYIGLAPTSGATTMAAFNVKQTLNGGTTSLPLVVRVTDAQNRPVYNSIVTFSAPTTVILTTTSAATNSQGYAQIYATVPNTPGLYTVQGSIPGVTFPVNFDLTVPGSTGPCVSNCGPSNLSVAAGNGQVISEQSVARQLLMVQAKDSSGNPLSGVTINFTISQGAGTISCATIGDQFDYVPTGSCSPSSSLGIDATTDLKGYAGVKFLSTSLSPGQSFAQTFVNARVAGALDTGVNLIVTTVLINRPNNGGQAALPNVALLAPEPDTTGFRIIRGGAGETKTGAIQVQVIAQEGIDRGKPIPNIALNVSGIGDPKSTASATCAGGTPLTNDQGVAVCDVVLGPVMTSSPVALDVNVGGAINTPLITVLVTQGPPAKVELLQGNNQSGRGGQQFLLRARVTDAGGNPSGNVPVTWQVSQGSGTLSGSSTTTNASGEAQTTVTLGGAPGTVKVVMTAGTSPSTVTGTFNLTVNVNIGGLNLISGGNQTAVVGQAFAEPLVVQVVDDAGRPVQGAEVAFTVTQGSATVGLPTAITDTQGNARATVTAGTNAGPITVRASAAGKTVEFSLTARTPGPAINPTSFRNGASGAAGLTPCGVAIVSGPGVATGVQGTVVANSFGVGPLPLSLSNVAIDVNGVPAPIFWVSNTTQNGQTSEAVAFQTPCEITPGSATVVVRVGTGSTTVSNVAVSKYQPGVFESVFNGKKYAVLLREDGTYVTPDNPARRGDILKMFVTGMGPVNPATATNRAGIGQQISDAIVAVGVNNAGVRTIRTEYLQGAIGIYVITFEVPSDTQPGPYQNLGLIVTDPRDFSTEVYAPGSFLPII